MKPNPTQAPLPVNRPRAVASGTIFGNVDCYVLEDGTTVLSQSGMIRGLRGKTDMHDSANLNQYLARLPEKYSGLAACTNFEFIRPDGGVAIGRPARDFVAMCRAYAEMYAGGDIHKARIPMARNAIAILAHLADRGIDEIVYEAANWHPRGTIAPQGITASDLATALAPFAAGFEALTKMMAAMNDRLTAVEDRQRDGQVMARERVNAIKKRVASCALDLGKYGIEKRRAASLRIHKRLKMAVGWFGDYCRLDNMPARHEADVLRALEIVEHETNGAVAAAQQLRFPALALVGNNNAKRTSA